jgi:ferric-dicitrate binding protein FerR (iron transport regulator)
MVAKDKSRPFIVHTPQGDVKVLGTEFVVNTNDLNDQDEPSTTITLVKGSVSVTPNSGTERVLKPGQQLKLMNNQLTVNEVDTTPFVAWNNGTFVFENCTLMRLMSVLSKWYGYHVTFESLQARTIRFTGELDKYSSIEPALEAIEQVTGLDIELHQERIIIK